MNQKQRGVLAVSHIPNIYANRLLQYRWQGARLAVSYDVVVLYFSYMTPRSLNARINNVHCPALPQQEPSLGEWKRQVGVRVLSVWPGSDP